MAEKIEITSDCDGLESPHSGGEKLCGVAAGSVLLLLRDDDRDYYKVAFGGQPVFVPKSCGVRAESEGTREKRRQEETGEHALAAQTPRGTETRGPYWIWVPYFRRCRVAEDKIEVTPPLVFGRGFLFDRVRRMVTVRQRLFWLTLSEEEIPFPDAAIRLRSNYEEPDYTQYGAGGGGNRYSIEMTRAHGKTLEVFVDPTLNASKRASRILAAIRRLGIRSPAPVTRAVVGQAKTKVAEAARRAGYLVKENRKTTRIQLSDDLRIVMRSRAINVEVRRSVPDGSSARTWQLEEPLDAMRLDRLCEDAVMQWLQNAARGTEPLPPLGSPMSHCDMESAKTG